MTGLYGFGGPVGDERFYAAYEDWCRERGIVTTFVRFHPRFQNQRYSRFHVEPRGGTVAWRLEGDLFERLHRHHRRAARKAAEHVETSGHGRAARKPGPVREPVRADDGPRRTRRASTTSRPSTGRRWRATSGSSCSRPSLTTAMTAALLGLASKPWLHYHLGASRAEAAARTTFFSSKPRAGRRPRATSASTSAAASAARTTRCFSSSSASTRAG